MRSRLIKVLVLAVALALVTTGITVAQQTTSLHKQKSANQATTTQPSSSSPSQVTQLTNDGKRGGSTASSLPQSMQSGVQQSAQSAQPAASSGPVYGPYSHSIADTSTLYRGFGAMTYGFVYPVPNNLGTLYLDFYYYDSTNQQLVHEGYVTPHLYTDTVSGKQVVYYDSTPYDIPTSDPSGTWVIFAGNCDDPLNPTNGCVENYSTANVS